MSDQETIAPMWKVRLTMPGSIIHLLSRSRPRVVIIDGRVHNCEMDLIQDTDEGDTLGFVHWPSVIGVAWRAVPGGKTGFQDI
jgi:hypothetical protein